MLEFALILPLMLFMLAFCIDAGRMIYASHAAQQALADAARQAAVFGAAGQGGSSAASYPASRQIAINACNASQTSCQMALYALHTTLSEVPGGKIIKSWTLSVAEDPTLKLGSVCSALTPSIKLTLAYDIDWLMPGMNTLLSVGSETPAPRLSTQHLTTSAVVRCEVEEPTGAPAGTP